jgi:hypothetical protein
MEHGVRLVRGIASPLNDWPGPMQATCGARAVKACTLDLVLTAHIPKASLCIQKHNSSWHGNWAATA